MTITEVSKVLAWNDTRGPRPMNSSPVADYWSSNSVTLRAE